MDCDGGSFPDWQRLAGHRPSGGHSLRVRAAPRAVPEPSPEAAGGPEAITGAVTPGPGLSRGRPGVVPGDRSVRRSHLVRTRRLNTGQTESKDDIPWRGEEIAWGYGNTNLGMKTPCHPCREHGTDLGMKQQRAAARQTTLLDVHVSR